MKAIIREYAIDDLYACAWENAISNVADVINIQLHTSYFRGRDWNILENIALKLKIRFDDNGEIIKGVVNGKYVY